MDFMEPISNKFTSLTKNDDETYNSSLASCKCLPVNINIDSVDYRINCSFPLKLLITAYWSHVQTMLVYPSVISTRYVRFE